MAQDINASYPTQTNPPSAEWPTGSAKNVSAPLGADGTPWVLEVINDIQAVNQGLLARAGINASGVPDVAVPIVGNAASLSQQIEALSTICGRAAEATTDILTTDKVGAEYIETNGYAARGDGGHAVWYATGVTDFGNAGTTDFDSGFIYDIEGTQFTLLGQLRNPRQFGAVGDNVADDTLAFISCVQSLKGGGVIYVPAGAYRCIAEVAVADKIIFRGESRESVTVSFETGVPASFPNGYCFCAAGSVAGLLPLASAVDQGGGVIDFAGNHNLAVDDLIILHYDVDFSLSKAQAYYRAGEFVRVGAVPSATEVTPARATFGAYPIAQTNTAKVTPVHVGFEGMTLLGLGVDTTTGIVGIEFGRDCFVTDCKFGKTQADSALSVDRCYGVEVDDLIGLDFENQVAGGRHMVGVWNAQRVRLTGLRGATSQAFLATGGKNTLWSVPCRDVLLTDSHIDASLQASLSVDIGGDTEFWRVADCTLGGIQLGGNEGAVDSCFVYGNGPGGNAFLIGRAVSMFETHGISFSLTGCRFVATRAPGPSVALVHLEDTSGTLDRAGVMRIASCSFDMLGFGGLPLNAVATSIEAGAEPSLEMSGCDIRGGSLARVAGGVAGAFWFGVGVRATSLAGAGLVVQGAEDVNVIGVQVMDSGSDGISVIGSTFPTFALQRVNIQGCLVRRSQVAGIRLGDTTGTYAVQAVVMGTESTANNQVGAVGAAGLANSSVRADTAADVVMTGNIFGSVPSQLSSYSMNNVTRATSVNSVVFGGLGPDLTGGSHNAWGTRDPSVDEHNSTGALHLKGATAAMGGTGADGLVVGPGTGNQGITIHSAAAGVSRLVMGEPGDLDKYRLEADHTKGIWNFYVDSGRHLRLLADALQFRRLYCDDTAQADASNVAFNVWGGTPVAVVRGSDSIVEIEVTTDAISGSSQLTFSFEGGAFDTAPMVLMDVRGDNGNKEDWEINNVTTTTAVIAYSGSLPIGVDTLTLLIVGNRT